MAMAMAMSRFYMLCLRLLSASGSSVAIYSLCLGCSFNKLYQYNKNGNRQGVEVFACFAFGKIAMVCFVVHKGLPTTSRISRNIISAIFGWSEKRIYFADTMWHISRII